MCWPDCAKGCGRRINLRIQACPFAAGSAANAASRAQSTAPRLNRADDGEAESKSRSEEHTSELQSLMRISYAVFCLKQKTITTIYRTKTNRNSSDTTFIL